jgi:hypothetical protein
MGTKVEKKEGKTKARRIDGERLSVTNHGMKENATERDK